MIKNTKAFTIYLPEDLYEEVEVAMKKENRSRNKQIQHWLRLGKLLEANPDVKMMLQLKQQLQ